MKALVLEKPGSAPMVEEVRLDAPGPGEVRVRIEASGVCHSDLHLADGDWPANGAVVLGHEGCGMVEEVGEGVDPALVGRRVVLDWMSPCQHCPACISGQAWNCSGTHALENLLADGTSRLRRHDGSELYPFLGLGTLSESIVVDAKTAVPIPNEVDPAAGALIGCCVSTGVGAVLKTADVPVGSSVVVYGLGGVGLSIVMGAVLAGASSIIAVDRQPAKLQLARTVGATDTIVAGDDADQNVRDVRKATDGGADFAFEAIGLSSTIEQTIRSLGVGGTAVLVGMTPVRVRASFDAFHVVDRSLRILGSNYGFTVGPVDFPRYADLYLKGKLPIDRLVQGRIRLEEVGAAFEAMRHGEGARRVVVFS
jgi:S-(hydroxymethyl)glutathione dehydrogenase/alcohol dehydrogenase